MSFAQRKATEYLNMLKQKSTEEITSMRDNLLSRLKSERAKPAENQDQSAIQNHNWQLSLLGRELASRKPKDQKEPMQAISEEQQWEVAGMRPDPIKSATLDSLNHQLAKYSAELDEVKKFMASARLTPEGVKEQEAKKTAISGRISAIEAEIATRSPKAQDEAKKDIARAEGKIFGVDKDILIIGGLCGVITGAIGWGMGKSGWMIAGFAVVGVGIGAGATYGFKSYANTRKIAPSPTV